MRIRKTNVCKMTENERKNPKIIVATLVIICTLILLQPIAAVIIYEAIFAVRYEPLTYMEHSVTDFDGLSVERSDFSSGGYRLAGYKYSKDVSEVKGVCVLAHGLGGGGQNQYMPLIDAIASGGYYVFTYDARANGESEGDAVGGLPQGVIDLDNAINHTRTVSEYVGLPIMLFGHSWGAYSVGCVLNLHPEVKAAVMVAGFNESEDMLIEKSSAMAGPVSYLMLPFLTLWELIKYGDVSTFSAISGANATDARIMIVHSSDDATVPSKYGYDKLYPIYGDNERFFFVLKEKKGHEYILYSDDALEYKEKLNADYTAYVADRGGEYSAVIKEEFMKQYLDKSACFEPDPELISGILDFYDCD